MKYRVEITTSARSDADAAYQWLAERTLHAAAWFNGLVDAIEGLAELPTRWPLARESGEFDEPIRQMLYGKTRISTGCCSSFGATACMSCMCGTAPARQWNPARLRFPAKDDLPYK